MQVAENSVNLAISCVLSHTTLIVASCSLTPTCHAISNDLVRMCTRHLPSATSYPASSCVLLPAAPAPAARNALSASPEITACPRCAGTGPDEMVESLRYCPPQRLYAQQSCYECFTEIARLQQEEISETFVYDRSDDREASLQAHLICLQRGYSGTHADRARAAREALAVFESCPEAYNILAKSEASGQAAHFRPFLSSSVLFCPLLSSARSPVRTVIVQLYSTYCRSS